MSTTPTPLHTATADQPVTLSRIRQLADELEAAAVGYCHWKSNDAIARSASGDNDLDLLIARADGNAFLEILHRLNFKQATAAPMDRMPGVLDYYGYDGESHRLVHVHAHFQLILGHDFTKNYRLPIETPFIASASRQGLFRIPAPEFEYLVFVIRMILKHAGWESIIMRHGRLSRAERRELAHLQEHHDPARLAEVIAHHLPAMGGSFFEACERALTPGCPITHRIAVARRLEMMLQAESRRPRRRDIALKLWRRVAIPFTRRVLRRSPGKDLARGGRLIAIVGGDGAGKTTAVDAVCQWLSTEFEVKRAHLGRPAWSWTTIAVRGLIKLGRSAGLYPYVRTPLRYSLDSAEVAFPGYPWLLREVCTARDRRKTYRQARRWAVNGHIVVCDRFPIHGIQLMDGPLTRWMTGGTATSRVVNWLIRREERYYDHILPPDLLIVLRVDPDIAVQRKTDEDPQAVRPRSTEIWEFDWEGSGAVVIDAGAPREEVLALLRELIWTRL